MTTTVCDASNADDDSNTSLFFTGKASSQQCSQGKIKSLKNAKKIGKKKRWNLLCPLQPFFFICICADQNRSVSSGSPL